MVRIGAMLGDQQGEFYADNRSMKYFQLILQHSPRIVSAYVGLNDGQFRQTRRLTPEAVLFGKQVPAGTKYSYHWLEYPNGGSAVDHNVFLDAQGRGLGAQEAPTSYDPRNRMWYRATVEANGLYITDPDVFATLGLIGFTVAQPFTKDGEVRGVVAIDITLDGLSEYIAEHKVSPNTLSYVLDHDGRVLAASRPSQDLRRRQGQGRAAPHQRSPERAAGARLRCPSAQRRRQPLWLHLWRERVLREPLDPAARFRQALAALHRHAGLRLHRRLRQEQPPAARGRPRRDGARARRDLFPVGHAVGAARAAGGQGHEDPGAGRRVAAAGAFESARDRRAGPSIDTLDSAAKSFASFVPIGLVKELLTTDAKTQLGGHSRFLTVMFSDLENFSSLSERIPTQLLLKRVSGHLELVIRSINEEHGTIDKFMGDGVMAFWGAPALLEDHASAPAWRRCASSAAWRS